MRTLLLSRALAVTLSISSALAADDASRAEADRILSASGVKGGIVVHLGAGDAKLTAALRKNASYQVQGLERDAAKVAAAPETITVADVAADSREIAHRLGLDARGEAVAGELEGAVAAARERLFTEKVYGEVALDVWREGQLPYIDNLVNLIVAEDAGGVPMEEIKRVLVPDGVALIKQGGEWKKTVKTRSDQIDEWTHYYYDAKGNAVSKDKEVGPPSRLQWVGSPRWSRHHDRMSSVSAQVTSKGRLYYIMDEGSRISILLPSKWNLIARDAFNGTVLWKKPIEKWSEHMWPLKSGPTQLTRRLVANGDRIFVTLGIGEPISVIDGASGEVVRTFPETKGAEEILHVDGVIYALVNPKEWSLKDFAPKLQQDQQRIAQEYEWDKQPRSLVAVDPNTGKVLWKKEQQKIVPITLSADGKRVLFYDGDQLVCLDGKSGTQKWASGPAPKRKLLEYNFGPRVVLTGETVLYAGGDGSQKGIDAETGKELWTAPHEKSGYRSPEDLLVAGGLVWNAGTLQGNQTGEFIGRDPRTGEAKKQFLPDVPDGTYWFHHRCYIAKGTENFLMPSRTGIEYVDIEKKHWDLHHWVRGACLYGVLPANGLTYAGPHNCACYPEAKLDGLNALSAATSPFPPVLSDEKRLEHGPAWGQPIEEKAHAPG
ncbi:MAG: PQQ-binding-like beta-propeller repeat protein, partial [Chthoniobacteraceae bacterium]